jgi:hypothetical protein
LEKIGFPDWRSRWRRPRPYAARGNGIGIYGDWGWDGEEEEKEEEEEMILAAHMHAAAASAGNVELRTQRRATVAGSAHNLSSAGAEPTQAGE